MNLRRGVMGGAAAGLEMLAAHWETCEPGPKSNGNAFPVPLPVPGSRAGCRQASPNGAPVRLGMAMGRARAARAAMDLSDGLADALRQVATASGVGLRIDADLLPIDSAARQWWGSRGVDPVTAAVRGGDDYELLFAVPAKGRGPMRSVLRHVADPPLTKIGIFTKDPREVVLTRGEQEDALPEGFEHFANR